MKIDDIKKLLEKGERINVECKESRNSIPIDFYNTYSAFANTKGGYVFLGIKENKDETQPSKRYIFQGVENPSKQISDLWNTLNGNKVNYNILTDNNVTLVEEENITIIVINIPRARYHEKPIYIGENPFKGTYKRNHEGDYHATINEIKAMFRDQRSEGNDDIIIEGSSLDNIDITTLNDYRSWFDHFNRNHVWSKLNNKDFLEQIGGYRIDTKEKREGLTLAGLMMFGKGLEIRKEFSNLSMDYRNESHKTNDERWQDRLTYDGRWENNLFNFFMLVCPKLMREIKTPFKLNGIQREDDTLIHKAIREAFVNMIIHADYQLDDSVLKIIKTENGFEFTNPGCLKIPLDIIYHGGVSKTRNHHIQVMMRMIGLGDNADSGFPKILAAWKEKGWIQPKLIENTTLNEVTLSLQMESENENNNKSLSVITPTQKKILKLIMKKPEITQEEMANKLGVSQKTIQRHISTLKKASILNRNGTNRNGVWEINSL